MNSVHSFVDTSRPPLPPHFSPPKPPPSYPPHPQALHPNYSNFIRVSPGEDEDVDIEDDEDDEEDEEELDEGEEGERDFSFPPKPPVPQGSSFSIHHIISPTNAPPSSSSSSTQSPPKKRDPPQPLSIPSSSNPPNRTSSQDPPPTPQQGVKKEGTPSENPVDLLKENRELRKKVEGLMTHNMQLMLGVKERDHKISRQKRLLFKYRKALLRFFEENNDSPSSSDDELSNMSAGEYSHKPKNTARLDAKLEAKLDAHLRNLNNPTSTTTAPSSTSNPPTTGISSTSFTPTSSSSAPPSSHNSIVHIRGYSPSSPPQSPSIPSPTFHDEDKDDDSLVGDYDIDISKKRKGGVGDLGDLEPDKKRRGPRRNALWTPEDDEIFQKIYNVYGKSWKTIHNYMPGKTREQVQSHGQYLIRIGKLEDIKSGPRRGRKSKKDMQSPHSHPHSSSHSPHDHRTLHHNNPPPPQSPHQHHTIAHNYPPPSSHHSMEGGYDSHVGMGM